MPLALDTLDTITGLIQLFSREEIEKKKVCLLITGILGRWCLSNGSRITIIWNFKAHSIKHKKNACICTVMKYFKKCFV